MRKLIILTSILLLITACQKKHADHQLRILLRNDTDSLIRVNLYPKSKYIFVRQYKYSDILDITKETAFVPDARLGSELYITDDISIEPHMLASKVFDSITISYSSGIKTVRFYPHGVINYSRNLFTDRSAWIYEKNRFERVKMWRNNYIESDDYTFIISDGI